MPRVIAPAQIADSLTELWSPRAIGDEMALRRMAQYGVTLTSTNQAIAELAGSWATPEGVRIVTELVMPALQG